MSPARGRETLLPSGAAVMTVTGRGARLSAQRSPASPPPTMITSSIPPQSEGLKEETIARVLNLPFEAVTQTMRPESAVAANG
jgi:hypothetical protein